MSSIKIHVLHAGEVCVSPAIPFGGEHCTLLKSLGRLVYWSNQARLDSGMAVDEQLKALGVETKDLDYVLLTHLDCDHASGLTQVKDAKNILASKDEIAFASKRKNWPRYQKRWWKDVPLKGFEWNGKLGPFEKSYDLFGDGSVELINIPGHCDGLFAVKVIGEDGRFALLFSDGGYAKKSYEEMILPGIGSNRQEQWKSLAWIRDQSHDPNCVESLANHDPDIAPHVIVL